MVFFLCIPCLLLIAYFAVMGAFVPKYRVYCKEAVTCFMDKLKGRKCSISFDERMRLKFSGWLADKNFVRAARFFSNKRNFNITFSIIFIIVTIVSTYLFILLVEYLFIQSPCDNGACEV